MAENEKLTPDQAVRVLRAVAGKLEAEFLAAQNDDLVNMDDRTADIALVARLLADHIEHLMGNVTQEMLESRRPYVTKSGKVLTDAQIEAWADEAERGYDVSRLSRSDRPTDPHQ